MSYPQPGMDLSAWTPYEVQVTTAPATDIAISPPIGPKQRFEVAEIYVDSASNSDAAFAVRIGFGATVLPAAAVPAVGIIVSHGGIAAGSGIHGLPGRGGYDEELRITCNAVAAVGGFRINFLGRVVS